MQCQCEGKAKPILITFILLIAIAIIGSWLWLKSEGPYVLPVKWVKVQGANLPSQQEAVKSALIPFVTQGFLLVNATGIQQRLQDIPWVAEVSVKREWPDTLIIGVHEKIPVALWNDDHMINRQGDVFNIEDGIATQSFPKLSGPTGLSALIVERYFVFADLLKPLHLHIQALHLSARRAWSLTLDNGVKILLGRMQVTQRLQQFIKVYPQVLAPRINEVNYVDLRYNTGFAVDWKDQSQQHPAAT
ncbi:MAG: cell division protein FtsQ/DivIB [Legionellales bacterium]|nr:cell division protein FtsQ/DivIB [Legionellales bacterium]